MSNNMIHTELPFGLTMEDLSARYETHSDNEEFNISLYATTIHLGAPDDLSLVVDVDLETEHKNTGDTELESLSTQYVDLEASKHPITIDESNELEQVEAVVGNAAIGTWLRHTEDSLAKAEKELKSERTRNISATIGMFSLELLLSRLVNNRFDFKNDLDFGLFKGAISGGGMLLAQEEPSCGYRREPIPSAMKVARVGRS